MVAGKQTVFLLPETSGDLAKTADLECTRLIVSKSAVFALARAGGDLAAGCMEAGQGAPNSGEILGPINPNPDHTLQGWVAAAPPPPPAPLKGGRRASRATIPWSRP